MFVFDVIVYVVCDLVVFVCDFGIFCMFGWNVVCFCGFDLFLYLYYFEVVVLFIW